MKNNILFVFSLLLLALHTASGAKAAPLIELKAEGQLLNITLNVPDVVGHKVFTLENPDRLVVDVPTIEGATPQSLPSTYRGKLLKSVRLGRFNAQTSRFVFDLGRPVSVLNVTEYPDDPARLVIDITEKGKGGSRAPAISKVKKSEKPMIVIDAGHGGVDPGAHGPRGTQEKDIVLAYAKALKAELLKSGRYRVLLTREDDRFIMLRQRVEIARKAGGSLFISLHADSAPNDLARGLSVYTVSEKASDEEAEALAARENKADVIAGMNLAEERKDVADILISLAQRDTKNRSATFADLLVVSLGEKVKLLENTHRFAGFAVLKAPDIPSVLVEIGFLSHGGEEKLLKSKQYREKVTGGIANAVDDYFKQAASSQE